MEESHIKETQIKNKQIDELQESLVLTRKESEINIEQMVLMI